ncbi:hypothetical protein JTE90_002063 [Oedothorax gibbosus]|uniref:Meteorin-like protein n=1 Tax=Oedothorax gibbosus TaxID=931172 RepID=A0AAV6UG36_9ARAC|nr:hypothetical protein JTE90_002063 [Oedothorax gibbosus]
MLELRAWCVLLITLVLLLEFVSPSPVQRRISDECDWFGSGLDEDPSASHSVHPVYLRCREGKVHWEYPRGALRILLRLGRAAKEFQGCLKVSNVSSGASLYLEGHRELSLLHRNDSNSGLQRCFRSSGGQVALFLEASGDSLKKDVFGFVYDLQPIQPETFSECRPCTDKELIYSFCTSDFVVRGTISALYQNELMQRTELTIRSRKILRDSNPGLFQSGPYGLVHRPLHCGTRAGKGEFLFLGRWRLGDPVLGCAPRWSEWKKVRKRADLAECVLD